MSENTTQFEIGQKVKFIGFADPEDMPDNGELLAEGEQYAVVDFGETEDEDGTAIEQAVLIAVPNPNYDSGKRKSKNNAEYVSVDVFPDEIEAAADEEEEAPAKTTKRKTKAKTKAKAEEPAQETSVVTADMGDLLVLTDEEQDADILAEIEEAGDICEYAAELAEEESSLGYRLGGVLYNVRLTGAYKELDTRYSEKGGFELFVNERLSVGYRHAMYLSKIYATFRAHGIEGEAVARMGWTKAAQIIPVMNEDNASELVELAEQGTDGEGITVADLKAVIKETYSETGSKKTKGKIAKLVKFSFKLFEDSAETVRNIFEEAKSSLPGEDGKEMRDDEVFEHIMTEWAQEHLNVSGRKKRTTTKAPAKKTTTAKKTTAAKKPATKTAAKTKAPARKTTARGNGAAKKPAASKKTAAPRSTAKKTTARTRASA
jgi:hypothetical protein